MTRWLETDSLSNQDISSALAIGAYTADADRLILVQFFADQVAGNGDYVFYVTLRVNGAGSSYQLVPTTTAAVASGVTAIGGQSAMIAVRSGDVLTVYLDGLAGDNANPDTTVRWFELAALKPTTADRTLDVSSGGEAGVDWANVGSPSTSVDLSGTSTKANETAPLDAAGTRAAVGLAAANLDTQLAGIQADTNDIQDRLPGQLQDGLMPSYIEDIANNAITAAALAADVGTEIADAVRTELAVELARIDEDVSAGAHPGDAMALVDDAITAAKYDQSTAHPLAQADAGSTAVARTGADGDTLETLSDEIAGIEVGGGGLTAQQTRDAMKLAPTAGTPAAGSIDAHLDSILASGAGGGTGTYTDTVTDGADPLDNVLVQLSTDAAGTNMVYRTYTAADGTFTMHPDPGTYYVWLELAGYEFTQGAQVVVT